MFSLRDVRVVDSFIYDSLSLVSRLIKGIEDALNSIMFFCAKLSSYSSFTSASCLSGIEIRGQYPNLRGRLLSPAGNSKMTRRNPHKFGEAPAEKRKQKTSLSEMEFSLFLPPTYQWQTLADAPTGKIFLFALDERVKFLRISRPSKKSNKLVRLPFAIRRNPIHRYYFRIALLQNISRGKKIQFRDCVVLLRSVLKCFTQYLQIKYHRVFAYRGFTGRVFSWIVDFWLFQTHFKNKSRK